MSARRHDDELRNADWYRARVHLMTPQTIEANRRLCVATLELDNWHDGSPVTDGERADARECLAILDAAERTRGRSS